MLPDQFLEIAAIRTRRLIVATMEGSVRGYLLGFDDDHLVVYAPHRVAEDQLDWTMMLVSRSCTVLMETAELAAEDKAVQQNYLTIGGATFIEKCQARLNEEDAE